MPAVLLKPQRASALRRRHPWIFSGAVARIEGQPQPGETVEVRGQDGTLYGRGAYSPKSQISVRMWSFDPEEAITPAFFRGRLEQAVGARRALLASEASACRLVNAESDGLPGLIVDRYGAFLVCQFFSAGAEYWKRDLVEGLQALLPAAGIYERSDVDVRAKEGLPQRTGVLAGEAPPDLVEIEEGPLRYLVDIRHGHKTGFYLDQRESRAALAPFAGGRTVLNGFAYTGGFGLAALAAGAAHVTQVDASAPALQLARRNAAHNGFGEDRLAYVEGDVFDVLRTYRDEGRRFDVVILDPPKFVESRRHLERACRGYKDINLQAFKLINPGGLLFTFSCSGRLEQSLFQKVVADAALDAGRFAQIIHQLSQAADHPTALNFPEGAYLKGLICRVH